MRKKLHNCIYGLLAGIIVCIIGILRSLLPYMGMNADRYNFLLITANLLGCAAAVFAILLKSPSFAEMIIRFLSLTGSFVLCFIIGACLGIWALLFNLLNIPTSSASDNVSGMTFVLYFVVVVIVSLITISISAALKNE